MGGVGLLGMDEASPANESSTVRLAVPFVHGLKNFLHALQRCWERIDSYYHTHVITLVLLGLANY